MTAGMLVSVHREALARESEQKQQLAGLPPTPDLALVDPPAAVAEVLGDRSPSDWLEARQHRCAELWDELLAARNAEIEHLGAPSPKLCIFASGSYGRDEAMEFSDLDLFLVDDAAGADPERYGRLTKFELGHALTLIDRARHARQIQRFSQGGYYQEPQSFRQMLVQGDRQKEERSTLTTARSLLLARGFHGDGVAVN